MRANGRASSPVPTSRYLAVTNLNAQTGAQNKRAHARDEAREEGVEGKRADEAAVEELDDARDEDVTHVGVDQFEFGRRPRGVIFEEPLDDADHAALLRHNDNEEACGMDGWMDGGPFFFY